MITTLLAIPLRRIGQRKPAPALQPRRAPVFDGTYCFVAGSNAYLGCLEWIEGMPVELSQLTANRAVLEVRFENAVLLWDRAGSIFSDIRRLYPGIEFKNIQPNQQLTRLTPKIEFSMSIDRAFIVNSKPSVDFSELKKVGGEIFPLLIRSLEIADFTRIGLRILFQREFPNKGACADYILEALPSLERRGKHFGMDARVTDPEIALRWEGETVGCFVRFNVIGNKLKVDIPPEFKGVDPIDKELHFIQLERRLLRTRSYRDFKVQCTGTNRGLVQNHTARCRRVFEWLSLPAPRLFRFRVIQVLMRPQRQYRSRQKSLEITTEGHQPRHEKQQLKTSMDRPEASL